MNSVDPSSTFTVLKKQRSVSLHMEVAYIQDIRVTLYPVLLAEFRLSYAVNFG